MHTPESKPVLTTRVFNQLVAAVTLLFGFA